MDFGSIAEFISTVGFPIVCFCLCGWYVKYREDKNDEKLDKLNSMHDAQLNKLSEVIAGNTLALQKLTDMIAKGER